MAVSQKDDCGLARGELCGGSYLSAMFRGSC